MTNDGFPDGRTRVEVRLKNGRTLLADAETSGEVVQEGRASGQFAIQHMLSEEGVAT